MIKGMVKPGALKRARGGRAGGKKGHTTVNISMGHPGLSQGLGPAPNLPPPAPMPAPVAAAPPGLPAGGPPMPMRPPMLPPGGPPVPVRAKGGRVGVRDHGVRDQGPGDKMPKQPPGWREGEKRKTRVAHTDGKTDGKDIGRGPVITRARGGPIVPYGQKPAKPMSAPVTGSGIVAYGQKQVSPKVPHMRAGSKSGVGRLEKAHMASRGAAP